MSLLRNKLLLSVAVASACAVGGPAQAADSYQAQIQQWQQQRIDKLKAPESWLGVVNADELRKGASRVGSGADEDIVLPTGPDHLGTLSYAEDGTLRFVPADADQVKVDHPGTGQGGIEPKHVNGLYFQPDGSLATDEPKDGKARPAPTTLHAGPLSLQFYAYDGDYKHGSKRLIVTDAQAPRRVRFQGLTYFPVDPSWRVSAQWEPLQQPRQVEVSYVDGSVRKSAVTGKAVFFRDGKRYELTPYQTADDGEMLFVFGDRTSGKETYGGARFLFAYAKHGKLDLDFNKAINPPCAFIPFPVCPMATAENRLAVRVEAGEKKVHEPG